MDMGSPELIDVDEQECVKVVGCREALSTAWNASDHQMTFPRAADAPARRLCARRIDLRPER